MDVKDIVLNWINNKPDFNKAAMAAVLAKRSTRHGYAKFRKYDHVRIKDLSHNPCVSHFPHSTDAIVMYSYAEKYGGDSQKLCLWVNGHGEVSWYSPESLELIEHDREDLLAKWEEDAEETEEHESDLDWIFENGKDIASGSVYNSTIATALFACVSDKNIWGSHGEGYTLLCNARWVHKLAKPYLEKNDKEGWLKFAEEYKSGKRSAQ